MKQHNGNISMVWEAELSGILNLSISRGDNSTPSPPKVTVFLLMQNVVLFFIIKKKIKILPHLTKKS